MPTYTLVTADMLARAKVAVGLSTALPAANAITGQLFAATDTGEFWYSDGATLIPVGARRHSIWLGLTQQLSIAGAGIASLLEFDYFRAERDADIDQIKTAPAGFQYVELPATARQVTVEAGIFHRNTDVSVWDLRIIKLDSNFEPAHAAGIPQVTAESDTVAPTATVASPAVANQTNQTIRVSSVAANAKAGDRIAVEVTTDNANQAVELKGDDFAWGRNYLAVSWMT
jgi:hypothetical protein